MDVKTPFRKTITVIKTMETPTDSPANIDALLNRINGLATGDEAPASDPNDLKQPLEHRAPDGSFFPKEPRALRESRVSTAMMEELICKFLMAKGEASIRDISNQIGMPFKLVEEQVVHLKQEQVLGYADQAAMNDYICKLTEAGRARATKYTDY